jgi:phosphoesterase RecJ-like protein
MERIVEKMIEAYALIKNSKKVLLVGHVNPDIDALSSLGIMISLLESLSKSYIAMALHKNPVAYKFLPHQEKVLDSLPVDFDAQQYDLVIILDCGQINRTGIVDQLNIIDNNDGRIIEFDHHLRVEDSLDLELRNSGAASTTEILYDFLEINHIEFTKDIIDLILLGILSDTGNFLYPSASGKTMKIASKMMTLGAQLPKLANKANKNKDFFSLKLWSLVLSKVKINKKYGVAVTVISHEDLEKLHDEIELIGNNDIFGEVAAFLSNFKEVKVALVLREDDSGVLKGSLRTAKEDIDVSKIARIFGGGGHAKASGFSFFGYKL